MESRHHPVKWKRISVSFILFLLAVLRWCEATEVQNILNNTPVCEENEYRHSNFCCDKCPPGFQLKQACPGEGKRSECVKCRNGTFQDNMNFFPKCFMCREPCNEQSMEYEIQPCTNMKNRICGCVKGYYRYEIDDNTMLCTPCLKCGEGERETRPCEGEKNTECVCKYNHYRIDKRKCAPCTNCSSCPEICQSTHVTTATPPLKQGHPLNPEFILCLFVLMTCFIIVYLGAKNYKKIHSRCIRSSMSSDPEKQEGKSETHICIPSKEVERKLLSSIQPETVLPDCIPREIKTHEFIYSVLEIVPVSRFKELVRRLNVSEQDIDRAERDHRAFADAQYHMLMVWVESGTRGGKNVLPCPLLQECVNTLKDMNLTACAESIEEKFATSST